MTFLARLVFGTLGFVRLAVSSTARFASRHTSVHCLPVCRYFGQALC
jgi:hypothetical protein